MPKPVPARPSDKDLEYANKMCAAFNRVLDGRPLVIDTPCSMTISRHGKYSRVPLIGGDCMTGTSRNYVGKRGLVVLVFAASEQPGCYYEMVVKQAMQVVSGFPLIAEEAAQIGDDEVLSRTRRDVSKKEEEAHLAAQIAANSNNPLFGSW